MIGQVLDNRYRIESQLGVGGVGQVYLACHVRTGRKCAVKFLAADAALDQSVVQRFEREARTLGSLGHPGIVGVHDFAETPEGRPYIVMDYLEGEDLSARLKRTGPTRWEAAGHIFEQIAAALSAAHQAGVLHRDLKPGNVYLARSTGSAERVVLLDFGLAKRYTEDEPHLTRTGALLGTPFYMSPEQARGKGVDLRSDIYALGAILFQMLTGRPPFAGATLTEVLAQILTEPPPRVSSLAPYPVPGHLDEVLATAMAKDPERRFAHVAAFASAALQKAPDWARTASMGFAKTDTHNVEPALAAAARASALAQTGPTSAASSQTPVSQTATGPARRSLTWVVILGMIGSAAVAAVIAVLVTRSAGKSGDTRPAGSTSGAAAPPRPPGTPQDPASPPSITIGGPSGSGPGSITIGDPSSGGSGSVTIGSQEKGKPKIIVSRKGVIINAPVYIPSRNAPIPDEPMAQSQYLDMLKCPGSRDWRKCVELARKFPDKRLAYHVLITGLIKLKDIKRLGQTCDKLEKRFPNDPLVKQCREAVKTSIKAARMARKAKSRRSRGTYRD